jgi:hypothetical protein
MKKSPPNLLGNIGLAPNRSTSLDPQLQNRNKICTPGFYLCRLYLYTGELNFGQTIWDETQVLLGTSWGIWNTLRTREKNKRSLFPPPLQKEKN